MTPAEIIKQARELDPSFTDTRHPRTVAVNFLSRLQRRLVAEWAKQEEVENVETFEATFPLVDFSAGIALEVEAESVLVPIEITALHRPLDLYLVDHEESHDLELIRWGDRNRRAGRGAWIREGRLFFTGAASDWTDVARVVLTYTPTPPDIASLTEDLVLPSTAEELLVSGLSAFFARRSNDKELARPRREYIAEAQDAETLWIDELRRREGATISRTRSVW